MRSSQIKSHNQLYPSAVNNKVVEAKEYNELQLDVSDLTSTVEDNLVEIYNRLDNLQDQINALSNIDPDFIKTYYLDHISSDDVVGYEKLISAPETTSGFTESVSINNSTTTFDSYVTPSGLPGITTIPAGLWTVHGHFQFSNATGINNIHWDVYKRTALNVETLLFRISSLDISGTALQEIQVSTVQSEVTLDASDRLVVKVLVQTTGGNKTVGFHYSGTVDYAFITLPLIG